VKIPAYVTLPLGYDKTKTYPMVMLCHGHGGNHNEWGGFDKITNGLARERNNRRDAGLPGCGASTRASPRTP
jgi:pimeloyl-ACP methyl ester carboxylesterase